MSFDGKLNQFLYEKYSYMNENVLRALTLKLSRIAQQSLFDDLDLKQIHFGKKPENDHNIYIIMEWINKYTASQKKTKYHYNYLTQHLYSDV